MPQSPTYNDDDYADYDEPEQPQEQDQERRKPNWRRQLEADAKAGREAVAARETAEREAAAAKRDLALMQAGVDVTSGPGKLFAKAYDGDATVEAVKAAALEYGVIKPEVTPEERAAEQRIAAASSGGAPVGEGTDVKAQMAAVPMLTRDGWNPDGPEQILGLLRGQGFKITSETPGGFVRADGSVPITD